MKEEVEKERNKFKANDRAGYLQRRLPAPSKASGPGMFGGGRSGTPTYRQWFMVVKGYLRYHDDAWSSDVDKPRLSGWEGL